MESSVGWSKSVRVCLAEDAERMVAALTETTFHYLGGEPVSREPLNVRSHPELCIVLDGGLEVALALSFIVTAASPLLVGAVPVFADCDPRTLLRQIGGLDPLPADDRITRRGYYCYVLPYDSEAFGGVGRDRFLDALRAEGVTLAGKGYGLALHKNPLSQELGARYRGVRCPEAEGATTETLVTLHHPALLSDPGTLLGIADFQDQEARR